MNEIEQAIKAIENIAEYWTCRPSERQAAQLALAALREKAEREKGCEYCDPDIMDGNPIIHRHSSGYVGNGKFSQGGSCLTHFCPMCGKRLEVEP